MAKKTKQPNPFTGRWRIVSMSAWNQEFIDEEEEGYFEFDQKDNRTYFFESSISPNIIWVKLDKLDFTKTQKLDLTINSDRVGDVTAEFKATEPFKTLAPDAEK